MVNDNHFAASLICYGAVGFVDLVESEDSVGEHDRMTQVRHPSHRDALAQARPPHPQADEERAGDQHQQRDDSERYPVHQGLQGSILRVPQ